MGCVPALGLPGCAGACGRPRAAGGRCGRGRLHRPPAPQPGSPVYSSKCEDCVCTNRTDSSSRLNIISCTHVHCEDSCSPVSAPPPPAPRPAPGAPPAPADPSVRVPQGFELVDVPGQCCGKCQQTHCIIKRPGTETIILKVRGESPPPAHRARPASPRGVGRGRPGASGGAWDHSLSPAGSLLGWVRLCKGPGEAMTRDYR